MLCDVAKKEKPPEDPKLKEKRAANQAAVDTLKIKIGAQIKTARGVTSQDSIETESGVDRGIIGKIENGKTSYEIDSLLRVLMAVHGDETAILGAASVKGSSHNDLSIVLRSGVKTEIRWVMEVLERAAAAVSQPTARSGPSNPTHQKPQRSA